MIRSTFTLRPNHIRDLHEIINRPIPNAGAQLYRGVFTRDGAYQRPNSGDDNSTARVNTEPAGGVCVTPVAFEVTLFVNNAGPLSQACLFGSRRFAHKNSLRSDVVRNNGAPATVGPARIRSIDRGHATQRCYRARREARGIIGLRPACPVG